MTPGRVDVPEMPVAGDFGRDFGAGSVIDGVEDARPYREVEASLIVQIPRFQGLGRLIVYK